MITKGTERAGIIPNIFHHIQSAKVIVIREHFWWTRKDARLEWAMKSGWENKW